MYTYRVHFRATGEINEREGYKHIRTALDGVKRLLLSGQGQGRVGDRGTVTIKILGRNKNVVWEEPTTSIKNAIEELKKK